MTHLRYFILTDDNGNKLELTTDGNVPTELYDSNGLNLDLTTEKNVPVTIRDANGRVLELETNSSVPVTLQDQTTPPVIVYANKVTNTTTLSIATAVNDYNINVTSSVGITAGDYLGIFSLITNRYYAGTVLSIAANVLVMDTPIDSAFPIGATVGTGIKDMSIDGSVTPQIFSLRGADPGIDVTVDITRIMFQMTTNGSTSFADFGDIARLTRGVVIRRVDGAYYNYFNIKSNSELANIAYDYTPVSSFNPSGDYGIVARLTTGGQSKMGVVSRIAPGEDLQVIIQDDLTGILDFSVIFEGSVAIT